ncbi:hypothetical protein L1049_011889 [Liquidambar formosana]|uniref:Uncharacterized protein n=1 Tax=Liquidambar formosana TaxID=63359 RepID=A0AAP0RY06_LIQFO
MVAKEVYTEPAEYNADLQDLDEAEETLSFCDLPIYNDAAEWDDFSKEDQSSSDDQEEFFEFFSQDLTASTCPAESIIFCGKLIPYKQPLSQKTHKLETNTPKEICSNKSKTSRSDGVKSRCMENNHSINSPTKSQKLWSSKSLAKSSKHLLMFGLMRLPTEMELSDIKNRQHRRRTTPGTLFRSLDNGGKKVTVGKSRGKGLWRLLRALGCRSHHTNAILKASLACISPV